MPQIATGSFPIPRSVGKDMAVEDLSVSIFLGYFYVRRGQTSVSGLILYKSIDVPLIMAAHVYLAQRGMQT